MPKHKEKFDMSSFKIRKDKTIKVVQQEIRSLIQNFDWETNPNWKLKLSNIETQIKFYWEGYKNA